MSENLLKARESDSQKSWPDILEEIYVQTDAETDRVLEETKDNSGCTSLSMIIARNSKETGASNTKNDTLYFANIGDTRAVIVKSDGSAVRMTVDHNAKTNKEEVQRIKDGKGVIFGHKVGGQLSVTRAFGDQHLKDCGVSSFVFLLDAFKISFLFYCLIQLFLRSSSERKNSLSYSLLFLFQLMPQFQLRSSPLLSRIQLKSLRTLPMSLSLVMEYTKQKKI